MAAHVADDCERVAAIDVPRPDNLAGLHLTTTPIR
eukprot:SAG11_NODE_2673_length_3109_cov_1.528904_4_plen_35_part_00